MWSVDAPSNDIHIVPVADIVEHSLTDDCICGPTNEFVPADEPGDSSGFLVTHHSLDGREKAEQ